MIKVVAKNFIREEKVKDFVALAKTLEEKTNKHDEGCLKYELVQDAKNPNAFAFLEEWESKEALDKHLQAEHCKEILPQFAPMKEKDSEVSFYIKV